MKASKSILLLASVILSVHTIFSQTVSVWDGITKESFIAEGNGNGTKSNPFLIKTAAQLAMLADPEGISNVHFEDVWFRLETDIDLNGKEWTPIGTQGTFMGNFDGNNHVILNLSITNGRDNAGLFGRFEGGSVSNLGVLSGTVRGGSMCGGLAGDANGATITRCFNVAGVEGADQVGGIAGGSSGTLPGKIQYCYNAAPVKGNAGVGGLLGRSPAGRISIQNCYNSGFVEGVSVTGNIAGQTRGSISNCIFDKQLCPVYEGEGGTGKLSSEMTGSGLLSLLGDYTVWEYSPELYPLLKGMSGSAAAKVAATPVFLNAGETYADVKSSFMVSTAAGAAWSSSDENALSVKGANATVVNSLTSDAGVLLTASLQGVQKTFRLLLSQREVSVTYAQPENGALVVLNGDEPVESGSLLKGNTTLTVRATPDEANGYELDELRIGANPIANNSSFVLMRDTTVYASFRLKQCIITYRQPENGMLQLSCGGAAVISGSSLPVGSVVGVTTVPGNGYHLSRLTANGEPLEGDSLTIGGNTVFDAAFELNRYSIEFGLPEHVELEASGDYTDIPHGEPFSFMLRVDEEYSNSELSVTTGSGISLLPANGVYRIDSVVGDMTVTVSPPMLNSYPVTLHPSEGGRINIFDAATGTVYDPFKEGGVTEPATYLLPHGTRIVLNASPDANARFVSWNDGLSSANPFGPFAVTKAVDITARFIAVGKHAVTFSPAPGVIYAAAEGYNATGIGFLQDFKFEVKLEPAYNRSDISVWAGNELLDEVNGVYTVEHVREDVTVRATGSELNSYKVTMPSYVAGVTIQAPESLTVRHGDDFSFSLLLDGAYSHSEPVVTAGGVILASQSGVYTIEDVTSDVAVSITNVTKNRYTVTLPDVEGAVLTAGSGNTTEHGGTFRFRMSLDEAYSESQPEVSARGIRLSDMGGGVYEIRNVQEDVTVSVKGVRVNMYDVRVYSGTGGSAAAPETVPYGSLAVLTATPDEGYRFDTWTDGNKSNPRQVPVYGDTAFTASFSVVPAVTYKVSFTGTEHASVVSAEGYDINAVPEGSDFLFTVTPGKGYTESPFTVKSGSAVLPRGTNGVYVLPDVRQNTAVSVEGIVQNRYSVTLPVVEGASLAFTDPAWQSGVLHGEACSFTVTPAVAYDRSEPVVHIGNVLLIPSAGVYTIGAVTGDLTVSVEGIRKNSYTVSIPDNAFAAIPQKGKNSVYHGDDFTFTVTPAVSCSQSVPVVKAGGSVLSPVSANTYRITNVTSDVAVTVEGLALNTYTIGFTPSASGSFEVTPSASAVPHGSTVALKAIPSDGYYFGKWNDGLTSNPRMVKVTENLTFGASFEEKEPGVTYYSVALPVSDEYVAVAVAGYNASGVVEGNDFAFRLFLQEPFDRSEVTVKANGRIIAQDNGIYTIDAVRENMTVTVEGVVKNRYKVTLPSVVNAVVQSIPEGITEVEHGDSYRFEVLPDESCSESQPQVVAGGKVLLPFDEGKYEIGAVEGDLSVFVYGVTKNQYTVSVPQPEGASVTPAGMTAVSYGDDFRFTVMPELLYDESQIEVSANGLPLVPGADGYYTVTAVKEDKNIEISGVVLNSYTLTPEPSEGGTVTANGSGQAQQFPVGSRVLLKAEADEEHLFERWSNGSMANPYEIVLTGDTVLSALFRTKEETLYYRVVFPTEAGIHFAAAEGDATAVPDGATFRFSAVLEEGHTQSVVTVRADGEVLVPAAGIYSVPDVHADVNITVEGVVTDVYKVAVPPVKGVTVEAASHTVKYGEPFVFDLLTDAAYSASVPVVNVTNGTLTSSGNRYTLTNVTGHTVVSIGGIRRNTYDLTLKQSSGGMIYAGKSAGVPHGSPVLLQAKADEGMTFSHWTDGSQPDANPRMVIVTDDVTYEAVFEEKPPVSFYKVTLPATEGATVSAVNGYNADYVPEGGDFSFRVVPDEGYDRSQVTVVANGKVIGINQDVYTVSPVTENVLVLVSGLERNRYNVSLTQTDGGIITASQSSDVLHGQSITLTAAAGEGRLFDSWSSGEIGNPYKVVVESDTSFAALFVQKPEKSYYRVVFPDTDKVLFVSLNGCDAAAVPEGSTFAFAVVPEQGYGNSDFTVFADGVRLLPSNGKYSIENVNKDITVTVAGITPDSYTVTTVASQGITVTPPRGIVLYPAPFSFKVTKSDAYNHYSPAVVAGQGATVAAADDGVYRIENITKHTLVWVHVKANAYPVTVKQTEGGTVVPLTDYTGTYKYGTSVSAMAVPDEGYRFVHWNDRAATTVNPCAFTVTDTVELSAFFEPIPSYTVELPRIKGVVATAAEGYDAENVPEGGVFKFKVELLESYSQSVPVVKVNGTEIRKSEGVYVIDDIREDKTVTVEGVVLNRYAVTTVATGNGSVEVWNADTLVTGGGKVEYGSVITVKTEAGNNYQLVKLTVNGLPLAANTLVVVGDVYIAAEFEPVTGIGDAGQDVPKVFASRRTVHIVRLEAGGCTVVLNNLAGQTVYAGFHEENDIRIPVTEGGMYVVTVDGNPVLLYVE
ncbi:MAG: InlB B-repeat-containing protein [Bacteroidales bacterium]|nr:InlB B-repeat-containing protein [Bacteroidales bacterium]